MGQRIESKLQGVHDQVMSNIQINNKAAIDKQKAMKMEAILYYIKNLHNTSGSLIDELFQDQAQILINESLTVLNANRRGHQRLRGDNLFRRTHNTSTSYGGDDIFEEELSAVLSVISHQATGNNSEITDYLAGSKQGNINLTQELDHNVETIMNKFIQRFVQKNNSLQSTQEKHWTKPEFRAQKVDVNGLSVVTAEADLHPAWKDLYQLFSNCTFSVKNYSSFSQSLNIYLGNSDYFKALYGVLSNYTGYSQTDIEKIIYSGINSFLNSSNKTVTMHFNHLRFIYELTGVGLFDKDGTPISGVDFLIYNDPSSDAIFVRSTADLIAQELRKPQNNSLFNSISLPKKSF